MDFLLHGDSSPPLVCPSCPGHSPSLSLSPGYCQSYRDRKPYRMSPFFLSFPEETSGTTCSCTWLLIALNVQTLCKHLAVPSPLKPGEPSQLSLRIFGKFTPWNPLENEQNLAKLSNVQIANFNSHLCTALRTLKQCHIYYRKMYSHIVKMQQT